MNDEAESTRKTMTIGELMASEAAERRKLRGASKPKWGDSEKEAFYQQLEGFLGNDRKR